MRDEGCDYDRSLDILLYISGINRCPVDEISQEDKSVVLEIHKHLRDCDLCKECYGNFKEELALEDSEEDIFSSETFQLMEQNEKYLDNLLASFN